MDININIPFKIDAYKIIPVFETIKVGRKKQDVFRRIEYKINGKPFGQIKGILSKKNIKETMEGLKKSSGFIRTELAKRINLRNTPELIFEIDDSMEYGAKIDSILKEIMPNEKN